VPDELESWPGKEFSFYLNPSLPRVTKKAYESFVVVSASSDLSHPQVEEFRVIGKVVGSLRAIWEKVKNDKGSRTNSKNPVGAKNSSFKAFSRC
jgi:hypothetical protein